MLIRSSGLILGSLFDFVQFPTNNDGDVQKGRRFFLLSCFWIGHSAYSSPTPDSILEFNKALRLQKKGQIASAAKSYRTLTRLPGPVGQSAKLFLSRLYLDKNKNQTALKLLEEVDPAKLPRKYARLYEMTAKSLGLWNSHQDPPGENRHQFEIDLGPGYNSNPQFISEDDSSSEASADGFLDYLLSYYYLAYRGPVSDFGPEVTSSGRHYFKENDSSYQDYEVSSPYNHYWNSFRLQIRPTYLYQFYAGEDFSQSIGLSSNLAMKNGTKFWTSGLSIEDIESKNDTYYYLDGDLFQVNLSYRNIDRDSESLVRLNYQDHNYLDSSVVSPSYQAYILQLGYGHGTDQLQHNYLVSYEYRHYSFDVTESQTRRDNKMGFNYRPEYELSPRSRIYSNLTLVLNDSSFDESTSDDKNYEQWLVSLGFNFRN